MLFYKASQRSTLLQRRDRATSDHENQTEDEGFGSYHAGTVARPDDALLQQIARAAQAEADTHTPAAQPAPPKDQRLSTFESELMAAWADG